MSQFLPMKASHSHFESKPLQIGYAAAFCGTVSLIPQIIKLWKERSAKAISATMYLIYTFGVVLWLIYGIMINSIPLIIAEIITLVLSIAILIMKYLWK